MTRDNRNHQWIKLALRKRGSSLALIAKQQGVSLSTVCMVSRGAGRSRRIETAIADVIGFPPAQIWPDRYETTDHIEITEQSRGGAMSP